jgi:hypothetical protein
LVLILCATAFAAAACTDDGSEASTAELPFEAASDCSVDVTGQLNDFIEAAPDGSTISFASDACHRIDETVKVVDKQGLTFEGNGATFKAMTEGEGNRTHWEFESGGGFTIRNLTVVGANPSGGSDGYNADFAFQHGFNFGGVDGVDISGVAITDVYGDFLRMGKNRGEDNRETSNVTITDSRFERSGRQGVSFAAATDVVIERNTFDGVARSVFDIEPNGTDGGAQRVRIADNDLTAWGNLVLPVGGKGEVADIELIGNRLHGKQLDVLVKDPRGSKKGDGGGTRRRNISIVGNVSDAPAGQTVVNLTMVDGVTVSDNVQPFDPGRTTTAMKFSQSCGVITENNNFEGAATMVESDDFACP